MKFLLTKELGRLAKWLRIMGFDASYNKSDNTGSLIIEALRQERVILTRNHRLPQSRGVRIVVIESEKLKEQLREVQNALKINPASVMMFKRCVVCNEALGAIEKNKVKERVPEYVFNTQENFTTCPLCKRIYWQGTHWGNAENTLKEIKGLWNL